MKNTITIEQANQILCNKIFVFGPAEIAKVFGVTVENVPEIPFSEEQLRRAGELGMYLIYQEPKGKDGKPLTIKGLYEQFSNKLGDGKLLCLPLGPDFYKNEAFFVSEIVTPGWRLVTSKPIPSSFGLNYAQQNKVMFDYLTNGLFAGQKLPPVFQQVVDDFSMRQDANILNELFRQSAVEVLYGFIVQYVINNERVFPEEYTLTRSNTSDGGLVDMGYFNSDGVNINLNSSIQSSPNLGVCFSCGE